MTKNRLNFSQVAIKLQFTLKVALKIIVIERKNKKTNVALWA